MASIDDVYGAGFHDKAVMDRALYAVKLYATNIVHKQFSFRNDSYEMWDGMNMRREIIEALLSSVRKLSGNMRCVHIDKRTEDVNMFPYHIVGAVEYFVLVEMVGGVTQLYSLYITPTNMCVY